MDEALRLEKVSYRYPGIEALRDVTLKIQEGELVGLVGPNGSGKTTLLKCLCRLLKPLGAVYLDERKMSEYGVRELARVFAYVPSDGWETSDLTVYDVVALGRTPHMRGVWWESPEDEQVISEVMRLLHVSELAERRFRELSSGERQMVRVARALAQRPRILLVDEPTSHLDLRNQLQLMETLKNLTRKGLTVVAALHDLNIAAAYSDKIIILDRGKVAAYGRPMEVLTKELIERVYGVKVKVMRDKELGRLIVIPQSP